MAKPEIPDKETKEILAEMEEEGEIPPHRAGKSGDADEDEDESDEDDEDEGDDEDKDDAGDEPDKKKKADPEKGEGEEEDEDEDEDEDDEDAGKAPLKKDGRPPKYIPLAKHQDFKRKHQDEIDALKADHAREIEALKKSAVRGEDTDDEVKQLAEASGVSADVIGKILDIAVQRAGKNAIDPDTKRRLDALKEREEEELQEKGFKSEFADLAKEHPEVKEHMDALKELAFTEEHGKKSLFEIYFRNVKPTLSPKKKSAEPSRGGLKQDGELDFEEIDKNPDLLERLTDEEFDEYSDWKSKNSKPKIRRAKDRQR